MTLTKRCLHIDELNSNYTTGRIDEGLLWPVILRCSSLAHPPSPHRPLLDQNNLNISATENVADQGAGPNHDGSPVRNLLALLPMTALWALFAQGILSVTRLLTSMTVGGKFTAESKLGTDANDQLGYYIIGFSTLMLVVALFEAFITTPLTVFIQKQQSHQKPSFSAQMLIAGLVLIGVIVGVSGALVVAQSQTHYLNPGLAAALFAAACLAPFQLLREFSRRWLLANLQAKESAILEVVFAVLFFVGVLFLLFTEQLSAVAMFTALAIINAIGVAGWWLVFRKQFDFSGNKAIQPLGTQISENVRYGRWVAGENVCGVLTMYFCNWFLAYRLDEGITGVFGGCSTVVMLANPFLLGIASILAPRAAAAFNELGYPGMLKVLIKFGLVLLALMSLLSLLLWFAGDRITTIMFPATEIYFTENFAGQNQITAMLGLALPAMGLSYLASCGLMAAHRPRDNFFSAIVGALVLIGLNLSFAETTLMTAAISFILSFYAATACRLAFLVNAFLKNSLHN